MRVIEAIRASTPLVHHITNYVSANDCANATLAIGASPVMSSSPLEAPQMASIASALVLNMGTSDRADIDAMLSAGAVARNRGIPVVFDPVGAGATPFRRELSMRILAEIRPDFVKGNAAELSFLAGLRSEQRGVDSLDSVDAHAMFEVSSRYGCVAVATGAVDSVCDGNELWLVRGGNAALGRVCGTGCMSASILASLAAVAGDDRLSAALRSCLIMKLSGEEAERSSPAGRPGAATPLGSFRAALMDALSLLSDDELESAIRTRCEAVDERA